jgi:pimeloyl-ACP methyl ester carboxylesterase
MTPRLPPGRHIELPGRGTTFIRETGPDTGRGPTIILLHGLSASADLNWFTCYSALAANYRVVALDQRGHGRGIRLRGKRFRLADCADDVAALADVLGIDRFVPVGYSMGGVVAQLVAHRHGPRVSGLVLCATSGSFASARTANRFAFAALGGMSTAMRFTPPVVRRQVVSSLLNSRAEDGTIARWARAELLRNDPAAVMQAAIALGRFHSREWLGDLRLPAAVVVTTADRLVRPARQYRLAESIAGATVHTVAGDHGVVVAAPRLFVPVLLDALRSVTSPARSST